MIRHNRLLVAFHVLSDALLGLSRFIIAYALRFHTGPDPDHQGHAAAPAVPQRRCRSSRCWCRSASSCRASTACGAAGRASTISSPSSSAASSPSCSASSRRCTCRPTSPAAPREDARRVRGLAAGLGDLPRAQRRADVRVARAGARGARAALARRHRPQADPDRRLRRARTPGRRQDPRAPRARLSDRRLRRRSRRPAITSATAGCRCSARSTKPPRSRRARRSIISTSRCRPSSTCRCSSCIESTSREMRRRQGRARSAAGDRAARAARRSRRRAGHQHQRRPAAGLQHHRQARASTSRISARRAGWCSRFRSAIIALLVKLTSRGAGVLPPGADGPRRQAVHDRQVPLDVRRCRARDRAGVGAARTTRA